MARYFILLLFAMGLDAQGLSVPCEPSVETVRMLEGVPPIIDTTIPFEQRTGVLRDLAHRHPDDFFIQRAYQDAFRWQRDLGAEFDRALTMYHENVASSLSRYFEARLLLLSRPQPSQATLAALIRENPKFPWPHLDFMDEAILPGKRGDPELASHRAVFARACPEAFQVVEDATSARRGLERRNSWLETAFWPSLWDAEQAAGVTHKELAERIRRDLKRIEAWHFQADPRLFSVYQAAARILQEDGVLEQLRTKALREAPGSLRALSFLTDEWQKSNPFPDRNASFAARQEWQDKEARMRQEWLKRWPNAWTLLAPLFNHLYAQESPALSAEDLSMLDLVLRVRAASPDAGSQYPPMETMVASIYAKGKVRLDQVPTLLDQGYMSIEKQLKYQISMELMPEEVRSQEFDWRAFSAQRSQEIRADYLLAMNRPADARALIEQALASLDQHGSRPDQRETDCRAWLARLEKVDGQDGHSSDLSRCSNTTAVETKPREFNMALPDFSVSDLAGKVWTLDDLKGKVTLVNYWATWCGPCRGEHPGLEEMFQRIKDRKDVQLLTISIDETLAPVQQYVKEQGYHFPVIHAPELADKLFPFVGLPTNFLVNGDGLRTSFYSFEIDSQGIERVIAELAALKRKQ